MGKYYRNPKTMQEKRKSQEGGVRAKRNIVNIPNDCNDGPRGDLKDRSWKGNRKTQWKPKLVKEAREMTFTKFLDEVALQRNDLAMQDYYDDQEHPLEEPTPRGYAVGWYGQGYEWRGDGPVGTNGRYKPYVEEHLLAINIPTFKSAKALRDQYIMLYDNGSFPEKAVYGRYGVDPYFIEFHQVWVSRMDECQENFGMPLEEVIKHERPKDYSK